jgi:thiol-disulfide isomerase/thioredoxin
MKKLTIFLLIFSSLTTFSQDPKDILHQSFSKCQSVKNGYYEMTKYMEYMEGSKSGEQLYLCHFSKLPDDDIYSSAFHYQHFYKEGGSGFELYTGNEYVTYYLSDSTGTIMHKPEWSKEIKSYAHNQTFYSVLTNKQSHPLLSNEDLANDKLYILKYLGKDTLLGHPCYIVQLNLVPEKGQKGDMIMLKEEYRYWIHQEDFIPLQYTISFDLLYNNDTMYQFERYTLNKYELNIADIDYFVGLSSIPSYVKLTDYKPYEKPPLLPEDTIAPNWKLPVLGGDSLSLSDLRGNVVLIDFFYQSCYPCMQALPAMEQLHEKYKGQPVRIIGIDPFDKPEDGIAEFLARRGVTYTVLLNGKNVSKAYRVSGYPTIYLIDKDGKVAGTQYGFGEGVEEKLDKKIGKLVGR